MSTVDAALFATPSVRLKLQELVELHRRYDSVLVTAYDWQKDDEASLSIVMLEAIVRVLCLGSNNSRQPSTPSPFASPSASPVLVPMEATATKEEDSTDGVLAVDALASALKLAINWIGHRSCVLSWSANFQRGRQIRCPEAGVAAGCGAAAPQYRRAAS